MTCYCDPLLVMESQIGNCNFGYEMDYAPMQVFSQRGTRQFCDLMSGDWAWDPLLYMPCHEKSHAFHVIPSKDIAKVARRNYELDLGGFGMRGLFADVEVGEEVVDGLLRSVSCVYGILVVTG
jgi:hypothetical protein